MKLKYCCIIICCLSFSVISLKVFAQQKRVGEKGAYIKFIVNSWDDSTEMVMHRENVFGADGKETAADIGYQNSAALAHKDSMDIYKRSLIDHGCIFQWDAL